MDKLSGTLQNVSSYNLMCNISNGKNEIALGIHTASYFPYIRTAAVGVPTRNSSVKVYVALTGVFVASTILLLVTLVLIIMLLFIDYKKGIRGKDTFAIQVAVVCISLFLLVYI